MNDIATELLSVTTRDHDRGCAGREYVCSCGYDAELEAAVKRAAEEIGRLTKKRAAAHAEGMEEAARIAQKALSEGSDIPAKAVPYITGIIAAIRKAKESKT